MSRAEPMSLGAIDCPICRCTVLRAHFMSMSGGLVADHIDVYCAACNTFILHVDCKPHERQVEVRTSPPISMEKDDIK